MGGSEPTYEENVIVGLPPPPPPPGFIYRAGKSTRFIPDIPMYTSN